MNVTYENLVVQKDLDYISHVEFIDWNRFEGKTVLITGAYGMLASYLVYQLCYLNEKLDISVDIIACGRSAQKAKDRFGDSIDKPYFTFMEWDMTELLPSNLDTVDFIIHAASLASPQYYSTDPIGVLLPNIEGVKNTLELARKCAVEGYLFISSGEVYGEVTEAFIREDSYGYLDPLSVRSCYGESKRMGETMCACWHHQYDVPATIVRPSHTYGPTMDIENDQRVYASFMKNIIKDEDIVMNSDGSAWRTFCYIADATVAYFKVLLDGETGQAYNVANEDAEMSILELAELLVSLAPSGKLRVVRGEHAANYVERKSVTHPRTSVDKSKALGIEYKFSPEEGFGRTIESFRLAENVL